jgi:hypothetical protein
MTLATYTLATYSMHLAATFSKKLGAEAQTRTADLVSHYECALRGC